MKKILVVAPHPDDETLGCGGTLLRYINEGHAVHWLIVTGMTLEGGFTEAQIEKRKSEIHQVAKSYLFSSVHELNLPTAKLDTLPMGKIIGAIGASLAEIEPEIVLTAYRNDAHSDHQIVFDAVTSATKSFRSPFVKKLLTYETISETDFGMKPEDGGFRPNLYVDIEGYLAQKLDILKIFESEVADFPFPRSRKALESMAYLRGSQCNSEAAEAFMLVKEII